VNGGSLRNFYSIPVLGCKTIKGADSNTLCIFPFRYKGKTYDTCTLKDADNTNNEAWCSTKVDRSGKHVTGKGKWGNCGQGCPFPNGGGKYFQISTYIRSSGQINTTILCVLNNFNFLWLI
jgi:hypothetical protein